MNGNWQLNEGEYDQRERLTPSADSKERSKGVHIQYGEVDIEAEAGPKDSSENNHDSIFKEVGVLSMQMRGILEFIRLDPY